MGLKPVAAGLLVLCALANLCDAYPQFTGYQKQAQKPAQNQRPPVQKPTRQNIQTPVQMPQKGGGQDSNLQSKQVFNKPLTWRFPPPPEVPDVTGVEVELRTPSIPDSLRIQCEEHQVLVEVDLDLFKSGQLINPADMTLGGCGVVGEDPSTKRVLFQSELHSCGSVLTVSPNTKYTRHFIFALH